MASEIFKIKSISQLNSVFGIGKPTHPLIQIIDVSKWEIGKEMVGRKFSCDLYSIALKDKSCGLQYGRNHYDFDEGVLIFTAPNQVTSLLKEQKLNEIHGWMMFFHPDLIRNSSLGTSIENYSFFSYDVHEALHLSDQEQTTITDCITKIQHEISERIDNHSQHVIVSSLELLLHYCLRYYERQFNTRTSESKDVISKVESLLREFYESGQFSISGAPSVNYLADKTNLSAHYLSDLLKKETGQPAKEHINDFIVSKAKTLLLGSGDSVSEIAYTLGFNYPHYFSRLFRSKTGLTPKEYRDVK